ncbi:aquaporin Z [Chamaesiphon sp. VAR_48_metabat_135_sub]|uniref:aquaporin Z n=1 Tax=Chamaesiphon sp. VAR_48_metabat_135_sub TaxID=2964699 RepID=UPI00286B507D|nr:aquaporin Z [Chamaesiphon sp. VAR_48_metabat_135_sub]
MPLTKRCIAEFFGTFWLVLGGCGSAVLAASYTEANTQAAGQAKAAAAASLGIGTFGVSVAFGLTVLTMAFAIGHISGCHLNPAVSFGLWAGKRFPASDLLPYILAQVGGAILAALFIYLIANGKDGYSLNGTGPLATNGFGIHSPQGYTMGACFLMEAVMTFMFLMVILGATDRRAPQGFAPIAIGLMLTLIHLISIPVTNTSVNPARSTGPALIVGLFGKMELFGQVWLFWVAPILGAIVAGFFYNAIFESADSNQKNSDTQLSGNL